METVTYGRYKSVAEIPNLVEMQTKSYDDFLQANIAAGKRREPRARALLREVFPIYSYDKTLCLEYLGYELGRPRYTPEECRKLRMTFGYPFKIRVRLVKPEPVEEEIYLGEIPIMIGGGEFIINGSERVTVSQLHRSPGVDFSVELHTGEKKLHSCWIIPERGSWIEINVTKKDAVAVRIDQSGKFSATTLLRAMDAKYSTDAAIVREFYDVEKVARKKSDPTPSSSKQLVKGYAVGDILDAKSGEPFVQVGRGDHRGRRARDRRERPARGRGAARPGRLLDPEHAARGHDQHARGGAAQDLQPAAPRQPAADREGEGAVQGEVLRRHALPARPRRALPPEPQVRAVDPESEMKLLPVDFVQAIKYIVGLRRSEGEVDDIDHLGNRPRAARSRSSRATSSARGSSSSGARRRSA
jgi:DNA-directed RNA polymerase subunit beta